MRVLKCYGSCGKKYPESELTMVGTKRHCAACLKIKEEKDELFEFIRTRFSIQKGSPLALMLQKQANDLVEKHGYKYTGIKMTLEYMVDVERKFWEYSKGMTIVVYYYEKAKAHYIEQLEKQKQMSTINIEEKVVQVSVKKKKNSYLQKKLYGME